MKYIFPLLSVLIGGLVSAQTVNINHPSFPQSEINKALHEAYINSLSQHNPLNVTVKTQEATRSVYPLLKNMTELKNPAARKGSGETFQATDTVIVGGIPHDTLRITGSYFNNGPIIVANDGVLIFHNANATIIGNIDLLGMAQVLGDSSSLTFPQQYFYQRALVATGNSYVSLQTCSLSYGGMSHNLVATDSSIVKLININNGDWTTAGISGNATVILNGSNLAGEYVMSGNATSSFKNANTLLLWHQLPETAVINFAFPDGDSLNHYAFNSSVSGVSGVGYSATIDTSWNVWWGMMPVNGSDVTISNSKIRTIGAWFENGDSASVSGLVDNSNYSNFVAPLNDRNLHLISSSVQTWSLYTFDSSKVSISSCILGEVGSQGASTVQSSSFFLDGSGGYFWSTDQSFTVAGSTAVTANVRSEGTSIFVFGYSTLTAGIASSIANSLLIVSQSGVPQDPVPYDGSVSWYQYISLSSAYTDAMVPVTGSEWIQQGPNGSWMSYGSYSLYYQTQGAVNWTPIVKDSVLEIHNGALGVWNTNGLATGNYTLRLQVKNSVGDSVDALKNITLLPSILKVNEINYNNMAVNIYPNPAGKELIVKTEQPGIRGIKIYNILGQMASPPPYFIEATGVALIDISVLSTGIYFVEVENEHGRTVGRFVKE